jgi:K+-transporting ATPase ATPase C chain
MKTVILTGLKMFLLFTVLTGVVYPLMVTGMAQLFFPFQSNGSTLYLNGKCRGSALLGQSFTNDRYFWGRPSAGNYATLPSAASNWGPTSEALRNAIEQRKKAFIVGNELSPNTVVPVEMLTASGSGLDPHISSASAWLQVNRIGRARNFTKEQRVKLRRLVAQYTEGYPWGTPEERWINVLKINVALDQLK